MNTFAGPGPAPAPMNRPVIPGSAWLALSLRTRLFAMMAAVLCITVLAASVSHAVLDSREQTRRVLAYELPGYLHTAASNVQGRLNVAIAISQALANDTFIQSWVKAGCPEKDLPAITQALVMVKHLLNSDAAFLTVALPQGGVRYYRYDDAATGIRRKDILEDDPSDQWYFRLTRSTRPFELNLDSNPLHPELLMYINYPSEIKTASGQLPLVVAGGGIGVQDIAQMISSSKVGHSGDIMLVRPDGLVDMAPDPAQSGQTHLRDQPGFARLLADDWRLVREQKIAVIEAEIDGQDTYLAAMYLPDLQRYLVAQLPADELMHGMRYNLWLTLAIAAILLTLMLALLRPLTWQLLKPLQSLKHQVTAIAGHLDLGTRLHTRDRAEFGDMCEHLNHLLERLYTAEERMKHLTLFYDSLTKLPNRNMFRSVLGRYLSQQEEPGVLSILHLDLDDFMLVNDTLGHAAGDQLLEQIARRLETCVHPKDIVARMGGDEFAVLLTPPSSPEEAREIAERMLHILSQPFTVDGHQIRSGGAIGIAMSPESSREDDLMKYADLALYAAKAGGHNQYRFFKPAMDTIVQRRMLLEQGLRLALAAGELAMHYQPLVSIQTGATIGYEALMRWKHPTLGNVPPAEFIPVAESTGIIVQLGEWAISQVVRDLATMPQHLHVAVNLSVAQLTSESLIPTVVTSLETNGVNPARLELEVTETVLLRQSEEELRVLHQLHDLGIGIALDDFGTGASSLNYLLGFPFDKIKIDKSFVDDIDTSEQSRAIVLSVITLAKALKISTTAEGIERQEQWDALRALGCVQGQGYLFSKPKPYADIR